MGKLANVNAALDVARTARQVLGANGVTLEYPAGVLGDYREQPNPPLAFENGSGIQETRSQAGIAGG